MVRTTLRHRNEIESLIDSIKGHNISLESMASTHVPEGRRRQPRSSPTIRPRSSTGWKHGFPWR